MILVSGATGLLGGTITTGLLEQGRPVRILVRDGSDHERLVDAGALPATGDLRDPASLAAACQGVTTVITTANSAGRSGEDTVETVEIRGNQALVDAAREAGVRHFIFVSALGASEDSPVPFLRGKALAERYLKESGLTYTILRPDIFMEVWVSMIVGMPLSAREPVTLVGEGRRRHSMISVRDVARFAVVCVDHPGARDQTLTLGGPRAVSWRDVVATTEKVLGRTLEVRSVPPGTPLSGLPDAVSQLAAGFETYDSEIPMEETARGFGIALTSLDQYAREAFGEA